MSGNDPTLIYHNADHLLSVLNNNSNGNIQVFPFSILSGAVFAINHETKFQLKSSVCVSSHTGGGGGLAGDPYQVLTGRGTPSFLMGLPFRTGWRCHPIGTGWGTLHVRTGWVYPYAADGMPLALTQEDFQVYVLFFTVPLKW